MSILFLTIAESDPTNMITTWKDLIVPILVVIIPATVSSIITYFATKSKSKSEIGQIDAETLKTYLQIIKDIQENNQSLYEKLQTLRERVESVDNMLDKAQDDLVRVQKELEDCMEANNNNIESASTNITD